MGGTPSGTPSGANRESSRWILALNMKGDGHVGHEFNWRLLVWRHPLQGNRVAPPFHRLLLHFLSTRFWCTVGSLGDRQLVQFLVYRYAPQHLYFLARGQSHLLRYLWNKSYL